MINEAQAGAAQAINLERAVLYSHGDINSLLRQYQYMKEVGRPHQAGRVLRLARQKLDRELSALTDQVGGKAILIARPGVSPSNGKVHKVITCASDSDFQRQLIFLHIYLKQPEVGEVIIDDPAIFTNHSYLLLIYEMAAAEGKRVRFNRGSFGNLRELVGQLDQQVYANPWGKLPFPIFYGIHVGIFPCNIRCRMCPQAKHSAQFKRQIMDFKTFELALDNVPADAPVKVGIGPMGEPLMMPNYLDYVRMARQTRPKAALQFNTNGVLLTEEMARGLVRHQMDQICFSLNVNTREDYKWFAGRDHFDQVCANIKMMARVKREEESSKPHIITQLLLIPRNIPHMQSFAERWGPYADEILYRRVSDWAGNVDIDREVMEGMEVEPFLRNEYYCYSLWTDISIAPDGNLFPCCSIFATDCASEHSHYLGNVHTDRITDVWRGEKLASLRMAQILNVEDFCRGCTHYKQTGEETALMVQECLEQIFYR